MPRPLNWPKDRSHRLGLGSLGGSPPQTQPDADHDVQGRPTPRAFAGAADTAPSAATEISYPAEGKVRFVYEGGSVTPEKAVSDAKSWAAREFFRQFEAGKTYQDMLRNTKILGVHVMPGKIVVNVGLPTEEDFRNSPQRFPSRVDYDFSN